MLNVTGIICGCRSNTPMIPVCDPAQTFPPASVRVTILKALSGEGSVAKTSALFIGRSTEPELQQGMSAGQHRCAST